MSNIIELLNEYRIVIPELQRDYAYGRESEQRKADALIKTVFGVLKGEKSGARLNYIYGVPAGEEVILIDGQQRTTTLYLFRLFLSINAKKNVDGFSARLSYSTRKSSIAFCNLLCKESDLLQADGSSILEKLEDSKNFYKSWLNDPTIRSMIKVLQKIKDECKKCTREDYQEYLENLEKIEFDFILLEGFSHPEELYMMMNGRGKQLTPFEIIKPRLFDLLKDTVGSESIEETINDKWTPAFWEYAKEQNNYAFAVANHDRYMYNYLKYITIMLWWGKKGNSVNDNDKLPTFEEALNWLNGQTESKQLLLFAMNSFRDWFISPGKVCFEDYLAYRSIHDSNQPTKTNIFGREDEKTGLLLEKIICENDDISKVNLLKRILLWAFILYKWNENQGKLDKHTLQDYFVLMRDIYAASWDSQTPVSITKNPSEHLVAQGIEAFQCIINGENYSHKKYKEPKKTFESTNNEKYQILNNYASRGCSNNIAEIVQQDGVTEKQAKQFADNLDFLVSNCENGISFENVKSMDRIRGKAHFICSSKPDRLYLPCTKEMLQSLFSMSSWAEEGWYAKMLLEIYNNPLTIQKKVFNETQWEYYLEKYFDGFVWKDIFAAFDFKEDDNNQPEFFEMEGVYGIRASKFQLISPFILVAYKRSLKWTASDKDDNSLLSECLYFVKTHAIKLKKEKTGFSITYDGQEKMISDVDVIEETTKIIDKIP